MRRFFFVTTVMLLVIASACSPAAQVTTSAELAGTYDCLDLENGLSVSTDTLTLNPDGSGFFGSTAITWTFDAANNKIIFAGDGRIHEATYFSDGPSLSVNAAAGDTTADASDSHLTCVKS